MKRVISWKSSVGWLSLVSENGVVTDLLRLRSKNISPDSQLKDARFQVQQYLEGKRHQFKLDLVLEGTPFQKTVWDELLKVPYGSTLSYAKLAAKSGYANAARAVGSAMAKNRLPIIVPCHRIIASDNSLGGYRFGLKMKRQLLDLEEGS